MTNYCFLDDSAPAPLVLAIEAVSAILTYDESYIRERKVV